MLKAGYTIPTDFWSLIRFNTFWTAYVAATCFSPITILEGRLPFSTEDKVIEDEHGRDKNVQGPAGDLRLAPVGMNSVGDRCVNCAMRMSTRAARRDENEANCHTPADASKYPGRDESYVLLDPS